MADLTVEEMIQFCELYDCVRLPTMDIDQFCRFTGRTKKKVIALLNNRLLPEDLLVYGYEGRRQRITVLFYTDRVIHWLKQIPK